MEVPWSNLQPLLLAWMLPCFICEGLLPTFPSSPHKEPAQDMGGQGTLLLHAWHGQLSSALDKPREKVCLKNLFGDTERVHRPINLVKNTNLANLLPGASARTLPLFSPGNKR